MLELERNKEEKKHIKSNIMKIIKKKLNNTNNNIIKK
jgi:hypothetical protein